MSEQRKWVLGILAAFLFGIAGGAVGAVGVVAFLHSRGTPPAFMAGGPGFERGERGARGGPRGMGHRGEGRPPMERIVTRHLDLTTSSARRSRASSTPPAPATPPCARARAPRSSAC